MDNVSGHTVNLANSIIGVSILAMPYCFKQCGILLSIILLLSSSIITRLACHYLLKSATIARRKTFEFLAFHIFGSLGKFSIEIGMIGFLVGTCIAFFVVMGDLGPAIISEITGVRVGTALRNSTLLALAIFCVLPLGLLRNVDSLNGVSKATIGFYCCLVLKIVIEALPHIFTGDWMSEVILWRPDGILQCLPIFSMALSCQTQLFEIYQAIPNPSLEKMNGVIKTAVSMCTWVYIFVGAFGYIAFFQKPFTGNILLSFRPSITSDVIKMGFVLSLAFSFPLVIFPCRASLYSLLYKRTSYTNLHDGTTTNYIPEGKFKMLTLIIVAISLIIALMIPSIELVLGIIGSTIGVMICVIFPVTCFICISPKNTNERIVAQIMLFVGVIVMVLGTYANLYAIEEAKLNPITEKELPVIPEISIKNKVIEPEKQIIDLPTTIVVAEEKKLNKPPDKFDNFEKKEEDAKEVRHEPPQPVEPVDIPVTTPPEVVDEKLKDNGADKQEPVVEPLRPLEIEKIIDEKEPPPKQVEDKNDKQGPVVEPIQPIEEEEHKKVVETIRDEKRDTVEVKKNDEVDIEAIKKEEKELKEDEEKKVKDSNQILIDTIQKQNEVQKEIVEQQKKLLEVIQKQQENANKNDVDIVNEEKLKAVKQIEDIAKKAIESISGGDTKNVKAAEEKIGNDKKEPQNVNNMKEDNNVENIKIADAGISKITKQTNKKDEVNSKLNLVPLPIALAKINNVTIDANETAAAAAKKSNSTEKKNESDVKTMRRDILSEGEVVKTRTKRETHESKIEKLNKAVKEVCNEINKVTSTEKPVIKMLCKLSEPNMMEIADLGDLDKQNLLDVNSRKDDLKDFFKK